MSDEEGQVLAAFARYPGLAGRGPTCLARLLNLDAPCPWCPVGPPKPGTQCATVPRSSRTAVERVLRALVRAGRVEKLYHNTRMMMYVVRQEAKS